MQGRAVTPVAPVVPVAPVPPVEPAEFTHIFDAVNNLILTMCADSESMEAFVFLPMAAGRLQQEYRRQAIRLAMKLAWTAYL